jgi:glutamate/aspartate transport system substrate-binding protein
LSFKNQPLPRKILFLTCNLIGDFHMKKTLLVLAALALTGSAMAQANDTLAKVKASGSISMGVRDSSGALSYTLGDGKYAGFHVEVCQRIVAAVEKEVGKKLETKYVSVTSANRIPLTQNGTVDIECGSTTNNATRQKDVSFLNTLYMEQVRIAVKAKSGITGIAQLNGKNVATTTGTTSIKLLRQHERATGMDFKEVFGKDHADSFLLLETDRAEAFVMDASILIGNIVNAKNPSDYRVVGEPLSIEPIGIMIRKDDPAFKKLGNDTIAALVKSGEIQKIYDKWFTQPIPPRGVNVNIPATVETKAAWANLSDRPAEDFAKK